MNLFSESRARKQSFLRPHQKKERLPTRARGGFESSPPDISVTPPRPDDPYWAWRGPRPGWEGHTIMWRPRLLGVTGPEERLTTMMRTGLQGVQGSGVRGAQGRTGRMGEKECLRLSPTKAMAGLKTGRSARGYSPFMLEIRCSGCGAGCVMTLASAEKNTVAECLEEMFGLLQKHWDGKTCEEVRDHLTALLVMET